MRVLFIFSSNRRNDAANRPKPEHIPKRVSSFRRSESPNSYDGPSDGMETGKSGSYNFNNIQAPSYHQSGMLCFFFRHIYSYH